MKKTNLYISVGNTRTSFALFNNDIKNIKVIKIDTNKLFTEMCFEEIINKLDVFPLKIFVCSVVEYANKKIVLFFKEKKVIFLNAFTQNIIKLNLLDNPAEIGNDIIASAIYAQSLGANVTIVSLGTATVVSKVVNNSITGCIILPGLKLSYEALLEKTDIRAIELKYSEKIIGKNTTDSLNIGVVKGHKIMISEFVKSFHELNTIYIYSGGNAHYINFNNWKRQDDIDLLGLYLFSISVDG